MNLKKEHAITVTVLFSLTIYAITLSFDFVFDDLHQILGNRWIRDLRNLPDIFLSSSWAYTENPSNYYRPFMHLIYMAAYYLFGLEPWGFHLVNVVFHTLNSVLVFLISSFILINFEIQEPGKTSSGPQYLPPLVIALLFSAHPINTEPVAWAAGVPELSFTFFYLLSFHLYVKRRFFLSAAIFFLSTLCKETSLTLPVMIFLYDRLLNKEPLTPVLPWLKRYWPFALAALLYFTLRTYALGGMVQEETKYSLSIFQYTLNLFPLFTWYMKKLILPMDMNAFNTFQPVYSIFENGVILSIAITLVLAVLVFAAGRASRRVLFPVSLMIVALLPALLTFPTRVFPLAEHFLYLPSIGFASLLTVGVIRLSGGSYRLPLFVFAAVTVLYLTVTANHLPVWKNEFTLWTDVVKKAPENPYARTSLGRAMQQRGMTGDAIEQYRKALKIKYDQGDWHYDLALVYQENGMIDEAIFHYREAIRYGLAHDVDTHNNLGNALARKGLLKEAMAQYEEALRIEPENRFAARNRSIIKAVLEKAPF